MNKLLIPFICCIALPALLSCNKESPAEISLEKNIVLRDKSLPVIQSYIRDQWKIHYSKGGISGTAVTSYADYTWNFYETNKLRSTLNGTVSEMTIDWPRRKTIFGDTSYVLHVINGFGYVADRMMNDTLVLIEEVYDGRRLYLTRIR